MSERPQNIPNGEQNKSQANSMRRPDVQAVVNEVFNDYGIIPDELALSLVKEFEDRLIAMDFLFRSNAREEWKRDSELLKRVIKQVQKLNNPIKKAEIIKVIGEPMNYKFPDKNEDKAKLIELAIPLAQFLLKTGKFERRKQVTLYPLIACLCNRLYIPLFRFEDGILSESDVRSFNKYLRI